MARGGVEPQRTIWAGPPDIESVDRACWGIVRVLERWQLDRDATIEAAVVANELLRNAVQHARTDWRLALELRGPVLHIAVEDGLTGAAPPATGATRSTAAQGRASGLRLVNAVALRWGWQEHDSGKTVWAELLA